MGKGALFIRRVLRGCRGRKLSMKRTGGGNGLGMVNLESYHGVSRLKARGRITHQEFPGMQIGGCEYH